MNNFISHKLGNVQSLFFFKISRESGNPGLTFQRKGRREM
jgi:hypothetical protein